MANQEIGGTSAAPDVPGQRGREHYQEEHREPDEQVA
jgi:hypothetical protein